MAPEPGRGAAPEGAALSVLADTTWAFRDVVFQDVGFRDVSLKPLAHISLQVADTTHTSVLVKS